MKITSKLITAALAAFVLSTAPSALAEDKEHQKGDKGDWFAEADTDQSGTLTLEELKASKGDRADEEKIAKAFAKMDADGDGVVTTDECADYCEKKGKSCSIKEKSCSSEGKGGE